MPRLREVAKSEASESVLKYYEALFGNRDPVAEPGTATGTPGNWWTVFALVPYIFDHATSHFGMFGMFAEKSISQLEGRKGVAFLHRVVDDSVPDEFSCTLATGFKYCRGSVLVSLDLELFEFRFYGPVRVGVAFLSVRNKGLSGGAHGQQ